MLWLVACALIADPNASGGAAAWPQAAPAAAPAVAPAPSGVAGNPGRALPPPKRTTRSLAPGGVASSGRPNRSRPEILITTGASLAVVLGLFSIFAWCLRGRGSRAGIALPTEAVETLGRFTLGGRQNVHLVRCGSKLLLVAVSPGGAETLTEITDPREVNHLLAICQRANPGSATTAFRDVLERLGRERAPLV